MSFLKLDWSLDRPAQSDVDAMLAALRVEPWPLESEALEELLVALRAAHINGGALFARFRLPDDPVLHWFGSHNSLDEIGFIGRLVDGPEIRAALPELELGAGLTARPAFRWGSAFTLDGELAGILNVGGAYERFRGTAREAKAVAWRACRDLFGERYDEVLVYRSSEPWSPWFHGVAWDATWVGVDKRESSAWVLCITDTD